LRETAQLAELSMKRDACSMPGLDPKRQPGIPDMEASRMMTFIVFITSFSFRILAAPVYLPAIIFLIVRHSPFSGFPMRVKRYRLSERISRGECTAGVQNRRRRKVK